MQTAERIGQGFNLLYSKKKRMQFQEFETMANDMEAKINSSNLSELDLEDKFWASLSLGNVIAYGIDNQTSLFDAQCKTWNLNQFSSRDSLIHGQQEMPGITTPFLYVGALLSAFGCHLEDGNLNSINYNHCGAVKIW